MAFRTFCRGLSAGEVTPDGARGGHSRRCNVGHAASCFVRATRLGVKS